VQHFLIIQTAFLGDVILATPLFSELKRIYPNAQVHVLVRKGNEALVSTNPHIDRLFVWNKKEGKYRSMRSIIRQLREFHYDEVINLQRYTSSAIITWFCKARIKIGFDSAAWGFVYDKKFRIALVTAGMKSSATFKQLTIMAHPASNVLNYFQAKRMSKRFRSTKRSEIIIAWRLHQYGLPNNCLKINGWL
jgi:ADP-heptose:LPS heptosyltransferase